MIKISEPRVKQRLLVVAQVLSLITMFLGLQFLINATGGTLFAFATLGPALVMGGILLLAVVAFHTFLRRHSLFQFGVYQPGEVIFRQGEPGDCAYFIQSGEVEVLRRRGGESESAVVAKLTEGKFFGEMALLTSGPRTATIRAATPTRVAVLGKQNFLHLCNLLPSAQADVLNTFAERASAEAEAKPGPKPNRANEPTA